MLLQRSALFCVCLFVAWVHLVESTEIWIDVPFVKQNENRCGAAVISMVVQYWSRENGSTTSFPSDPAVMERALYSDEAKGIYASDMERYFQDHGFQVFAFAAAWSDLEQHLSKGRPLIAAIAANGKGGPLHYVVVVGIDTQQGVLLINDPAERKLLKMKRSEWEKIWKPAGYWTLLAVPKNAN